MHEQYKWEPPKMERFSEKLLEQAKKSALTMLQDGEERKELELGEQKKAVWISLYGEEILGSEQFEVNGKTIYIGLLKNGQ